MRSSRTTNCFLAVTAALAGSVTWSAPPVLTPHSVIKIANSAGKFDFLGVDAAAHRLLAGHEKDGTADFFDLNKNQLIARVKVGPAVEIAVDPKTGAYFASVQDDKRIAVIDGKSLKEIRSIALPGESDAILFDSKDRRIYITHDNGKELWAVDPDSGKILATIAVPEGPEMMAFEPATNRLFLNSKATSQVVVIDTRTNSVLATWTTAPATAPHGLVLDSAHHRIFIAGANALLIAMDTQSGRVVAQAPIVEHVDQIAIDRNNRRIFCAGPGAMTVVQSSDHGLAALGNAETHATAKNVAVDPKTHDVWVTFTDGKDSYAKSWSQH